MVTVLKTCPLCGRKNHLNITDEVAYKYSKYLRGYGYIQDIPLSASEREFLKTGYCFSCQEVLFAEPVDDEPEDYEDDYIPFM